MIEKQFKNLDEQIEILKFKGLIIADESYAVENAHDDLKEHATGIISSNDEDGVAKWLEANYHKCRDM